MGLFLCSRVRCILPGVLLYAISFLSNQMPSIRSIIAALRKIAVLERHRDAIPKTAAIYRKGTVRFKITVLFHSQQQQWHGIGGRNTSCFHPNTRHSYILMLTLSPHTNIVFPAASTGSKSMGEEPAGGTAAWLAASTFPCDECGESNLLQLKDDIFKSLTLTF